MLPDHMVDNETHLAIRNRRNDHRIVFVRQFGTQPHQSGKAVNRQYVSAQVDDILPLQALNLVFGDTNGLHHIRKRKGVFLTAGAHKNRRNDGQCQRKRQLKGATLAGCVYDSDGPVELLGHRLDHVHPDSAPANIGNLFCGRKTRMEDQVIDLVVCHGIPVRDQPLAQSFVDNDLAVEPASVVLDFHIHIAAALKSVEHQLAMGRLPRLDTLLHRFDAMVHGVAQQMHERFVERVEDILVQLRVFALKLQIDFLAKLQGQVPHRSGEPMEHNTHRNHPGLHDARLQIARNAGRLIDPAFQFRKQGGLSVSIVQVIVNLQETGIGDHQFAHIVHQRVYLLGGDLDCPGLQAGFLTTRLDRLLGLAAARNLLGRRRMVD